jgi:thiamine-monophosphate kinase
VALPPEFGAAELKELHAGIARAADKYDCPLVGGDITCWKSRAPFAVSVAMLSRPAASHAPVRRSGAKVGDAICVTGALGGSGRRKHLEFEPRIREALKIAEASSIPISADAQEQSDPLAAALHEGEDFELLLTLAPQQWDKLHRSWDNPTSITRIGTITDTGRMQIRTPDGQVNDLEPRGYEHLQNRTWRNTVRRLET